jgi:type II secretory ATPase GspE/PulE/Tfp pilus assembly ATPase PilB-like protein
LLHELKLLSKSVITIEDPVEYQIDGITQIQVDPRHGVNFAAALKSVLRLDPDYLLLGEIRDQESARAALEAVSSGRALMATLHARDAVGAVSALHNWGLSHYEIAANLGLVISQRLVRRLCEKCKAPGTLLKADEVWLGRVGLPIPEQVWKTVGCPECRYTGYHGRTGVFEVWRSTEAEYELILSQPDEHAFRRALRSRGIHSLAEDGIVKAGAGLTTLEEVRAVAGQNDGDSPEMTADLRGRRLVGKE